MTKVSRESTIFMSSLLSTYTRPTDQQDKAVYRTTHSLGPTRRLDHLQHELYVFFEIATRITETSTHHGPKDATQADRSNGDQNVRAGTAR